MKKILIVSIAILSGFSCSRQQYIVSSMQAERYPVAENRDMPTNQKANDLVAKYKGLLDKEMGQIVGKSAQDMTYGIPESLLTNLTSDAMLRHIRSTQTDGCDIAIMNVNGHRSNLAKGNITLGNIFEIYSFENALVTLRLKGSDLIEIFNSYARMGGYGISSTVKLIIKDKKFIDAKVGGEPVNKDKVYKIVTLDYLAEGNDGMAALRNSIEIIPTGETLRDVMLQYVKDETKQGREVSSKLDGRVTVE